MVITFIFHPRSLKYSNIHHLYRDILLFLVKVNKISFLSIRGGDMTQYMPTVCLLNTHALLKLHKQIT